MAHDLVSWQAMLNILVRLSLVLAAGWGAYGWTARRNPRWTVVALRWTIAASFALPAAFAILPSADVALLPIRGVDASSESPTTRGDAPPKGASRGPQQAAVDERPLAGEKTGSVPALETATGATHASASAATAPAPTSASIDQAGDPELLPLPGNEKERHLAAGPLSRTPTSPRPSLSTSTTLTPHYSFYAFYSLLGVWLLGFLLLAGRLVLRAGRTRILVQAASAAPNETLREGREIAARLGLRSVPPIRISPSILGPCTAGWIRPVVLLPETWRERMPAANRRAILAHEISHIAERDMLWDLAAQLAVAVWWLHPLAWRLSSKHRLACEHRSDAVASEYISGFEPYRSLLAKWGLRLQRIEPGASALAMADRSALLQRLRWLERPRTYGKIARRDMFACFAAALVLLVAVATVRPVEQVAAQTAVEENSQDVQAAEDGDKAALQDADSQGSETSSAL